MANFLYPQLPQPQALTTVISRLKDQYLAARGCAIGLVAIGVPAPAAQAICTTAPGLVGEILSGVQ